VNAVPVPGTVEVREAHRFDAAALERYMARHVEGFAGPLTVRQFEGGQSNPTYYMTASDQEYVLRRKPPGRLLPSAHLVEREYRILAALAGTGVPVPRTYVLCEDSSIIGTAFYIMDYVPGRVFGVPRLPDLASAERAAIYDSMAEVLARLHQVDWQARGLADFGRPGNYFTRQIHRWTEQYRASETETIPPMERLIAWLPQHVPADDQTTVVHGDYRLANMIVHPTEPRIVAVLDWELSTLGHPLADLAYNCMPYRLSRLVFDGLADEDLGRLGIPGETDYVAAYCRRVGRGSIPDWEFYLAFAMFRLAAIVQGIMGRVRMGTAAGANAAERGALARPLADAAWAVIADRAGQ
jgi:aminoglycoside phosphotransferase (APT) family kinase protein